MTSLFITEETDTWGAAVTKPPEHAITHPKLLHIHVCYSSPVTHPSMCEQDPLPCREAHWALTIYTASARHCASCWNEEVCCMDIFPGYDQEHVVMME